MSEGIATTQALSWPPSYTLKYSKLAKHVRFKSNAMGLEIVVPTHFNIKKLPELIETNRKWIEKHLLKQQLRLHKIQIDVLPTEVSFPLTQQQWQIAYIGCDIPGVKLAKRPHQLEITLVGNIANKDACKRLLNKWARLEATSHLSNRLDQLSKLTGLHYSGVKIRNQKQRWGSCSFDKIINLNYKIIFLQPDLVDHILLHELCHTKYFDHSPRFWNLLASFDTNWQENNKIIKTDDAMIPGWAIFN